MTRFTIPSHWSPEQALAVYELLHQLSEQLWCHYQLAIHELIGPIEAQIIAPRSSTDSPTQLDLFDPHDVGFDSDDFPF